MRASRSSLALSCVPWAVAIISGVVVFVQPLRAQSDADTLTRIPNSAPVIRSMRDREGISIDAQLDELAAAPLPARVGSTGAVTVPAALAVFRRLTTVTLPINAPQNPAALRAAAAVLAHTNPLVAQAYLLEAERVTPADIATRISMATLLIAQGYPYEALALIGPSAPAPTFRRADGISLRAGWWLTRGNALLCGNRPAEAIDPLRTAGDEDPSLLEAARSLTKAHLLLGNRAAARESIRRASRQSRDVRWDHDTRRGALPYNRLYDLSRSQHRELMLIEPPTKPQQVLTFFRMLQGLQRQIIVAQGDAATRVGVASAAVGARKPSNVPAEYSLDLGQRATADAMAIVGNSLGVISPFTSWDPVEPAPFSYLDKLNDWTREIEDIAHRDGALGIKQREMLRSELSFMDVEPRQTKALGQQLMQPLPNDHRARCAKLMSMASADLPNANALFFERDHALREWFTTAWSLASAIASHAPYGPEHDLATAQMELDKQTAEYFRVFEILLVYGRYNFLAECEDVYPPEGVDPVSSKDAQDLLVCDPFLRGMNFKIKVPDSKGSAIFELGITCDKLSIKSDLVKLIPDILTLKAGLEWTPGSRGGEITGLIGVSAGVPGLPVSVSSNVFVTTNSSGALVDGGLKTSLEQNVTAGNEVGSIKASGTVRPGDVPGMVRGAVDTVTEIATGGGAQVVRDAVLYWAPGAAPDA